MPLPDRGLAGRRAEKVRCYGKPMHRRYDVSIRALLCMIIKCREQRTGLPSSTFRTVLTDPPLSTWPALAFARTLVFRTMCADPPLITWPVLAFARFCYFVHWANSDLCQALKGTIGCNNSMEVWNEKGYRHKCQMEKWREKRMPI